MSIKYIDDVYTYQTEEEIYHLIKFWEPDVRILGEDYISEGDDGKPIPDLVGHNGKVLMKENINKSRNTYSVNSLVCGTVLYDLANYTVYINRYGIRCNN